MRAALAASMLLLASPCAALSAPDVPRSAEQGREARRLRLARRAFRPLALQAKKDAKAGGLGAVDRAAYASRGKALAVRLEELEGRLTLVAGDPPTLADVDAAIEDCWLHVALAEVLAGAGSDELRAAARQWAAGDGPGTRQALSAIPGFSLDEAADAALVSRTVRAVTDAAADPRNLLLGQGVGPGPMLPAPKSEPAPPAPAKVTPRQALRALRAPR
jgi:hypothetical protein